MKIRKLRTPNSEPRTVWVTLRTDAKLYDDLAKAARAYHISQSEITRKALRKAERLKPDLEEAGKKLGSTYQGGMLRLEIERSQQRWTDELRAILRWYLDLTNRGGAEAQRGFKTDMVEGRDYLINHKTHE